MCSSFNLLPHVRRSAVVFGLVVVTLLATSVRSLGQGTTDRKIFEEAVATAKAAAPDIQWFVLGEIAEAQAAHGYYDDALDTSRPIQKYPDQLFISLVRARAKRGDVAGAARMAESAVSRDVQLRAEQAIASAQVTSGDLTGAKETVRRLPSPLQQTVLQTVGIAQANNGELDAALKTASEMEVGWNDDVLYAVATKFRERGDKQEAHQIAKRVLDRDMRRDAELDGASSPVEAPQGCWLATQQAKQRKYTEASKTFQANRCECGFVASVYGEARDVGGAEAALHNCSPNPSDVSAAAAELAKKFAQSGDIAAALKFAEAVHVPGADEDGEGYLAPALREVAHAWVKKEGADTVLKWARSRPTGYERAMALLGVAESLPNQPQSDNAAK